MISFAFYLLTALLFSAALLVILSKNPMSSVLWMVVAFFAITGHYVLLNAQFLVVVNLIVYAGAIMVLFIYTVMLLNLNKDNEPQRSLFVRLAGIVSGGLLLTVLVAAIRRSSEAAVGDLAQIGQSSLVGLVKPLGLALFKDFLVPFELSSALFLAALVGAVALGKKEVRD
jgi:NADH-quinone oxidoreductase subunit J